VNVVAEAMVNEIRSEKDYQTNEYLGFIYIGTDGQLHASALVEGTSDSVTINPSALGLTGGSIVAMIHSHDPSLGTSQRATQIQDDPSVNDWAARNTLISEGADPNFGQYIVGPDSVGRYFDGSNQNDPVTSPNPPKGVTF